MDILREAEGALMEEQLRFMDHMTAAAIDMAIRFGPKVLVARRNIVIPVPQREIRTASSTAYLAARRDAA